VRLPDRTVCKGVRTRSKQVGLCWNLRTTKSHTYNELECPRDLDLRGVGSGELVADIAKI
jgi:hypothetical protein